MFSVTSTEALLTVETVPVANFSYDVLAGGLIRFSNLSLYADGYFWGFGDGTPAADSVDVTHQYTQSGIYTVTLTANNPCGASVLQVDIQVMLSGTGQAIAWYLDEVKVFPNPATGHLNLEYPAAAGPLLGVQVLDTTGKCLYEQSEISNVYIPWRLPSRHPARQVDLFKRCGDQNGGKTITCTGSIRLSFLVLRS
ncbi:MAG: PKD domain-containing protein [Lewinellaceae bacterium]|nr:PKD domain-containing protein [Lewinellaceae bacterium]